MASTAVIDFTIKNNANSDEFLFRGVDNVRNKQSQPVITVPLVNNTPITTDIFRFFGQSEEIAFDFAIFDDGTDITNGSKITPITTVPGQINYLKTLIFTATYDTDWTFTDDAGLLLGSTGATANVVITNLEANPTRGSNTLVIGTIILQRGVLTGTG